MKAVDAGGGFVTPNPPSPTWLSHHGLASSVRWFMLLNKNVEAPGLQTQNISLLNATQYHLEDADQSSLADHIHIFFLCSSRLP
jgi:hypothetical protein